MADPVLMVVDDNPASLQMLADALRRRYGHDYLIISETVPHRALGHLRELQEAGQPAAVVMASAAMVAPSCVWTWSCSWSRSRLTVS